MCEAAVESESLKHEFDTFDCQLSAETWKGRGQRAYITLQTCHVQCMTCIHHDICDIHSCNTELQNVVYLHAMAFSVWSLWSAGCCLSAVSVSVSVCQQRFHSWFRCSFGNLFPLVQRIQCGSAVVHVVCHAHAQNNVVCRQQRSLQQRREGVLSKIMVPLIKIKKIEKMFCQYYSTVEGSIKKWKTFKINVLGIGCDRHQNAMHCQQWLLTHC